MNFTGGVCPFDLGLLVPGVATTAPIFLYMANSLCNSEDLDEHTSSLIATSEIRLQLKLL